MAEKTGLAECPKCGSKEIAARLLLFEDSKNYKSSFEATKIGYYRDPDAIVMKDKFMQDFHASACTVCGYLEFYLDNPAAFSDQVK